MPNNLNDKICAFLLMLLSFVFLFSLMLIAILFKKPFCNHFKNGNTVLHTETNHLLHAVQYLSQS